MNANFFDAKAAPITGFLLAALLGAGATGCHGHKSRAAPAAQTPAVAVVTPVLQSLQRTILQPGYARPYEQTPIYARVPGYVESVPVDIGDAVKKGQLLARLRVPELEKEFNAKAARVGQAEAHVKQADASYEAAKANVETTKANVLESLAATARGEAETKRWTAEVERGKKLSSGMAYDKQTLDEVTFQKEAAQAGWEQSKAKHLSSRASVMESEARRDKARADIEAAKESLMVARADRDQAQVWLDYRDIRAPYDGVITLRNVHPGHFLQTSSSGSTNKSAEPIFTIVNMDIVRITVQIPEYDAPLVKDGAEAVIQFQGLKDAEIAGKVTRMTDVLDNDAHTLKVEIHLANADRKLRPGMYVNAAIKVATPRVWTLPGDAVFTDGEKSYCFVVDNGKATKTALKTGVRNDTLVEVLKRWVKDREAWEDFTGTEKVVAANPESLIDGQAATIVPARNDRPGKD